MTARGGSLGRVLDMRSLEKLEAGSAAAVFARLRVGSALWDVRSTLLSAAGSVWNFFIPGVVLALLSGLVATNSVLVEGFIKRTFGAVFSGEYASFIVCFGSS